MIKVGSGKAAVEGVTPTEINGAVGGKTVGEGGMTMKMKGGAAIHLVTVVVAIGTGVHLRRG